MKTLRTAGLTLLMTLAAWSAEAGPPTEHLQSGMDRVFQALIDPAFRGADNVEQRRTRVFALADEIFDFGHTARLALGPHWDPLTPAEREEFVALFKGFVQRAYIMNVELYEGERVLYTDETVDGERATVRSKIVTKGGNEIPVEFRMRFGAGDRWRLYDVAIEGSSLVANYRVQFNKVIRVESYAQLLHRLRAKQLAGAPGP